MRLEDLLKSYACLPLARVAVARPDPAGGWVLAFASAGLDLPPRVAGPAEAPPAAWGGAPFRWRGLTLDDADVWVGQPDHGREADPAALVASLGHELRTPLNGILGAMQALARTDLAPPQADLLALIRESGTGLERLLTELLDFARLRHGAFPLERRPFDPAHEIASAARLFESLAAAKGVALTLALDLPPETRLWGDALRVRQIVSNLTSNAVKFTQQGEVRIEARLAPGVAAQGETLEVAVSDTGPGLPPHFQARLFAPFAQADAGIAQRYGGSGLGLSLCRALAERMGGAITAESQPGRGSRFLVRLPADPARPQEQPSALPPAAWRGLRLLAADDHPVNRRVLELVLEPLGVQLTLAEDGETALQLFCAMRFDAVLLDLRMPGLDGAATLARMRRFEAERGLPRTPIALTSADGRASGLPADGFIAKPISAEGLLHGLSALLATADRDSDLPLRSRAAE